jgi:hypothetical protein
MQLQQLPDALVKLAQTPVPQQLPVTRGAMLQQRLHLQSQQMTLGQTQVHRCLATTLPSKFSNFIFPKEKNKWLYQRAIHVTQRKKLRQSVHRSFKKMFLRNQSVLA